MRVFIISGPQGSGKTMVAEKLTSVHGIVLDEINAAKFSIVEQEFTELQLQHIEAFAVAAGLTVHEVKEDVRSIKSVASEGAALVLSEGDRRILQMDILPEPVKVEQRDRIPVPNHYKRNRFQR